MELRNRTASIVAAGTLVLSLAGASLGILSPASAFATESQDGIAASSTGFDDAAASAALAGVANGIAAQEEIAPLYDSQTVSNGSVRLQMPTAWEHTNINGGGLGSYDVYYDTTSGLGVVQIASIPASIGSSYNEVIDGFVGGIASNPSTSGLTVSGSSQRVIDGSLVYDIGMTGYLPESDVPIRCLTTFVFTPRDTSIVTSLFDASEDSTTDLFLHTHLSITPMVSPTPLSEYQPEAAGASSEEGTVAAEASEETDAVTPGAAEATDTAATGATEAAEVPEATDVQETDSIVSSLFGVESETVTEESESQGFSRDGYGTLIYAGYDAVLAEEAQNDAEEPAADSSQAQPESEEQDESAANIASYTYVTDEYVGFVVDGQLTDVSVESYEGGSISRVEGEGAEIIAVSFDAGVIEAKDYGYTQAMEEILGTEQLGLPVDRTFKLESHHLVDGTLVSHAGITYSRGDVDYVGYATFVFDDETTSLVISAYDASLADAWATSARLTQLSVSPLTSLVTPTTTITSPSLTDAAGDLLGRLGGLISLVL